MATRRNSATKAGRSRPKRTVRIGSRPAPRRPRRPPTPAEAPSAPAKPETERPLLIVGVGASAGGLEAFGQLLEALPPDPGLALVFVQHLSPRHRSALPELLAAKTGLVVVQASDTMPIEANHVYIIPPDSQMGVAHSRLQLSPRPDDRTRYTPIDFLFHSMADDQTGAAVGVVLSGTASDGAIGLRDIKAAGGITMVQDPATAKYDGMPRAAIGTGAVDFVLPPQQLAAELVRIAQHPYAAESPLGPAADTSPAENQLHSIFALLRSAAGVDFRNYKLPTIKRRLHRRMVLHKIDSLNDYLTFLNKNPDEVRNLYHDLLINVTHFFREPESFTVLRELVFPRLLEERREEDAIRIWVPGCSTGEEAYSVAIELADFLAERGKRLGVQIFATDVSDAAVEQARRCRYAGSVEADVSPDRLRRYFVHVDGSYRVSKAVRDLCIFARQDLTRDPPFSRLDLIVCRNVLIYLTPPFQKRLMNVFHYALRPTGFLMLAPAETVGGSSDLFAPVDKRARLYRRKSAGGARLNHVAPQGAAPGARAAGS